MNQQPPTIDFVIPNPVMINEVTRRLHTWAFVLDPALRIQKAAIKVKNKTIRNSIYNICDYVMNWVEYHVYFDTDEPMTFNDIFTVMEL